ncbi:Ribokinase-like protein [Meira miltonrushii]|uniref:Ribokinase-like protein n=1 Tax=Meira miltonrushii TaxID=1280837 RepID=A0A316VAF6_9BASI|nr:Ribokinase-like protein [Meira miltonrushii]PWN34462.1 Ribokinase-like protein [Meira miltonrushii]
MHHTKSAPSILVVGYAAVDITGQKDNTSVSNVNDEIATTWPGRVSLSLGGVGRNMAEAIHGILQGQDVIVKLVSPVGTDNFAKVIEQGMSSIGLSTSGLMPGPSRTASVMLLLDKGGDLITGIADIDESRPSKDEVDAMIRSHQPSIVVMDGNISKEAMEAVLTQRSNSHILFEPTSVERSVKVIQVIVKLVKNSKVAFRFPHVITPNVYEVVAMHAEAVKHNLFSVKDLPNLEGTLADSGVATSTWGNENIVYAAAQLAYLLQTTLLVKGGRRGVLVARYSPSNDSVHLSHHPAKNIDPSQIVNTTGAGDTFASAIVAGLFTLKQSGKADLSNLCDEKIWSAIVAEAQNAALLTLQSGESISSRLQEIGREWKKWIE